MIDETTGYGTPPSRRRVQAVAQVVKPALQRLTRLLMHIRTALRCRFCQGGSSAFLRCLPGFLPVLDRTSGISRINAWFEVIRSRPVLFTGKYIMFRLAAGEVCRPHL